MKTDTKAKKCKFCKAQIPQGYEKYVKSKIICKKCWSYHKNNCLSSCTCGEKVVPKLAYWQIKDTSNAYKKMNQPSRRKEKKNG